MKNIAIILARSGSKGLTDKNIRQLHGKPLLAYSIDAAVKSGLFDEIMVSTDSEKYAGIARAYGAKTPFLRSFKNSSDTAGSWDTVREVLDNYRETGDEFDSFCLLQPTSPLRTEKDIIGGYNIFNSKNAVMVTAVCETDHPHQLYNTLKSDNSMEGFIDTAKNTRRQNFEQYYRINGALYIVRTDAFYSGNFLYAPGSYAYIMDKRRSIDIDDAFDFEIAEFLLKNTNA